MAWISVHEQVIGGKLRDLAKEIRCSQNEALGLLVRFWLWGINNADKEGRIISANKDDVAEVVAVGMRKSFSPTEVVDALVKTNWIDIDDGLYIHDWEEWQEQWYKAIEIREKDAKRKREERAKKREERKRNATKADAQSPKPATNSSNDKGMEEVLPTPKLIITHKGEPPVQPEEPKEEYPKDFNMFWSAYPRKVGKGDAYKKYKARINSGWKPEELIEAAKNYASKVIRENTETKFIKHPKTFLSDTEPFVDFLPHKEESEEVSSENTDDDNPYADWREQ